MACTPADVDAVADVFVDTLDARVTVASADGHHLQRVRRLAAGERITAADGSGAWREYEIASVTSGRLELEACADIERVAPPAVRVELAIALTKAGLDAVVPALTELGVARITPVRTERAGRALGFREKCARCGPLARAVCEAAMQSRRADIPAIDPIADLASLLHADGLVVADHDGESAWDLAVPPSGAWTVLVGPEGGLSPRERADLAVHSRLRLAPNVLRATTAPVAAAAVLAERIAQIMQP